MATYNNGLYNSKFVSMSAILTKLIVYMHFWALSLNFKFDTSRKDCSKKMQKHNGWYFLEMGYKIPYIFGR